MQMRPQSAKRSHQALMNPLAGVRVRDWKTFDPLNVKKVADK
jgi:hypothetical protein